MDFLKGKRTYIVVILGGLVFVAMQLGFIDATMGNKILEFLGLTAVITLRAAIK